MKKLLIVGVILLFFGSSIPVFAGSVKEDRPLPIGDLELNSINLKAVHFQYPDMGFEYVVCLSILNRWTDIGYYEVQGSMTHSLKKFECNYPYCGCYWVYDEIRSVETFEFPPRTTLIPGWYNIRIYITVFSDYNEDFSRTYSLEGRYFIF